MSPLVCGGVISVMMIQVIGPIPSENELKNIVTQISGSREPVEDSAVGIVVVVVESKKDFGETGSCW